MYFTDEILILSFAKLFKKYSNEVHRSFQNSMSKIKILRYKNTSLKSFIIWVIIRIRVWNYHLSLQKIFILNEKLQQKVLLNCQHTTLKWYKFLCHDCNNNWKLLITINSCMLTSTLKINRYIDVVCDMFYISRLI